MSSVIYFGVCFVAAKCFKIPVDHLKARFCRVFNCSFYRVKAPNNELVVVHLFKSYCYRLRAYNGITLSGKKQSLRVRLLHVYHSPNKVVMYINKQINKQKSTSKKTITCNRPIHIYSHSHLLYNSAENEWIWMNSGALWVHCWGLALADFGFDPRSSDSLRGSQNFVLLFCPPISCRTNFYDIWTQQRRSASPYKRSEHNFGNFTIRGRFFPKKNAKQKMLTKFPGLSTSGATTPKWLQIARNSLPR